MTRLLVSVRDAAEARVALAAGVDLIDVKEPRRGGLGRADAATVSQVVDAVEQGSAGNAPPVSVALGELLDAAAADDWPRFAGIQFAKLGLAGCGTIANWPDLWARALDRLPTAVGRVAVVYADWQLAGAPEPEEVLAWAVKLNVRAALVDTFDKNGGSLVDWWSPTEIANFIRQVKSLGLLSVVGGGLKRANLRDLLSLAPDYLAVRGAACRSGRAGSICRQRVGKLVDLLRGAAPGAKKRHAQNCRGV